MNNNNKFQTPTSSIKSATHTRQLKLQPFYRRMTYGELKIVPQLLLCGNWLERAGFFADDYVTVKVKNKKLVISLSATAPGEKKI